jgi:hypothetical protein
MQGMRLQMHLQIKVFSTPVNKVIEMMILQEKFEDIDITSMKIYYYTETGKFIHNFSCDKCGTYIFRVCYETLEDAFTDTFEGMLCAHCSFTTAICENPDILNLVVEEIEKSDDPQRLEKIAEYVSNMLSKSEIMRISHKVIDYDVGDCKGHICERSLSDE